jgi:short-subunit dehydrogenase
MSTARPIALVTGASAGIGRAFVHQLADRGYDLVVVARDRTRLELLADEMRSTLGADVEVLAADLIDAGGLASVEARCGADTRPIDLLVNNAGFGTFGRFHDLAVDQEEDEIRLNVVAVARLAHAALGGMVARGRGGVINVASVAAYQPTPHSATYGATKAFVRSFSQAVHEELHGTGVKCMALCPGFTRTEFQSRAGVDASEVPGLLWQQAGEVVHGALRAYDEGRAVYVPGRLNSVAAALTSVTPTVVTRKVAGFVMGRADRP